MYISSTYIRQLHHIYISNIYFPSSFFIQTTNNVHFSASVWAVNGLSLKQLPPHKTLLSLGGILISLSSINYA